MDFMSGKGVVPIMGAYIEREVSECRRVTEKELSAGGMHRRHGQRSAANRIMVQLQ